jgi:hypothetical protein
MSGNIIKLKFKHTLQTQVFINRGSSEENFQGTIKYKSLFTNGCFFLTDQFFLQKQFFSYNDLFYFNKLSTSIDGFFPFLLVFIDEELRIGGDD